MNKELPKDEALYEKIRNYCLGPWVSTRERLPEYGVPVLMAWHHNRNNGEADLEGFDGFSFGVGARYHYKEELVDDKKVVTSHIGINDSYMLYQIDSAYHIGISSSSNIISWNSHDERSDWNRRKNAMCLKDPYLKKNKKDSEPELKEFDYWVNFNNGKYGSKFCNLQSADMSFIPESSVKKILKKESEQGYRCEAILNSAESYVACYPDFWMEIPKIR